MTTRKKKQPKLDHPGQAMDTDLPDPDYVNEDAFKALQDLYKGDPDD